ncbi:unnamed protein product [Arabis nemorensis]|uniref:Ycf20-like protein n=1 Tax=Arabis nemorensis TaxID=586526 RepID=A0A565BXF1_9BRAS|nr:unnamed protein product [Arabis nemorensis]
MGVEELRNLAITVTLLPRVEVTSIYQRGVSETKVLGNLFSLSKYGVVKPLGLQAKYLSMSSTTIRSSVGGGRFDPPFGSSSNKSSRCPRLIKAIQDLRSKLLVKIQEIKKDLPMKLYFLLVGFYSATAFSTFIRQTGDWDVLSAALAVIVVECIGALMYRASVPFINKMRSTITMFNYWKT